MAPSQIDRFFNRECDLKLETAGRLAAVLDLSLCQGRARPRRAAELPPGGEV